MGATEWTSDDDLLSLAGIKRWRSTWASPITYLPGDGVKAANGNVYICILENLSGATTQPGVGVSWATYWDLLVPKGDTGATGATGATGPQGPQGNPGPGGGTNTGFDVVVAADGSGNYTTLTAALTAGYKRIFIKAGTYVMGATTSTVDDLYLIGENFNDVILQSSTTGAGSIGFTFSGARVRLENMTFRGVNAGTTEIVLKLGGDYDRLKNLRFDKAYHHHVDGNNSKYAVITECFFDGTGFDTGYACAALYGFGTYSSDVSNCYIFLPSTVAMWVSNNSFLRFVNCHIKGDKLNISGFSFTNCLLQSGYYSTITANMVNCWISDGGYTVTNPFITFNGSVFIGNKIYTAYNTCDIIKVNSQFSVVNGNQFSTGHRIYINAEGVSFQNNVWYSTFLMQNNSIELTASAVRCQVNYNTAKGEAASMAPVITDAGSNNNKVGNILYV